MNRDAAWAALHDPATTPDSLADIAAEHAEFAEQIAAHPNAYPELVEWAAQVAEMRQPPAVEDGDAAAARAAHRRRIIKISSITGAIVVPVVTAATILIPIAADWTQRDTSIETFSAGEGAQPRPEASAVEASAAPMASAAPLAQIAAYDGGEFETSGGGMWMGGTVPADAPFETFPTNPGADGCSPEQVSWLREWGVPTAPPVVMSEFRNDATRGAALSLQNLRAEGEFVEPEVPRLPMWCFLGGIGEGVPPIWTTLTLGDATPAVYMENPQPVAIGEGLAPDLIGTPFLHNLAPGEYAQVYLVLESLDESKDFVGRVVADVIVGGETYESVVKEGRIQTAPPGIQTLSVLQYSGSLYCFPDLAASSYATGWTDVAELAAYECSAADLAVRAATEAGLG